MLQFCLAERQGRDSCCLSHGGAVRRTCVHAYDTQTAGSLTAHAWAIFNLHFRFRSSSHDAILLIFITDIVSWHLSTWVLCCLIKLQAGFLSHLIQQQKATDSSLRVVWILGKHKKPFSDAEIIHDTWSDGPNAWRKTKREDYVF